MTNRALDWLRQAKRDSEWICRGRALRTLRRPAEPAGNWVCPGHPRLCPGPDALNDPGDSPVRRGHGLNPRYADFPQRAAPQEVLGLVLPVASLEDILQGKVWAALDPERRASKRQKDLADIARLQEASPHLQSLVPAELRQRLL